jgi:16S rRNA (adenine1518-N6/adenine1519-N6)-dimethyltransferase
MAAEAGKLSILGITAQYYWQVELGRIVSAHLFYPLPKVDSQIVSLKTKKPNEVKIKDEKLFFKVVKAGFSQKRKKISNGLSEGLKIPKTEIEASLEKLNIDPGRRPQTLSIEEWTKLYEILVDTLSNPKT